MAILPTHLAQRVQRGAREGRQVLPEVGVALLYGIELDQDEGRRLGLGLGLG